jgi:hypothetical protein
MGNPRPFIDHLRLEGYHPRSDKHSNSLAECVVADLVQFCPAIRSKAAAGELVYDLNFTLTAGTSEWNSDLVLGAPPLGETVVPSGIPGIHQASPSLVEIAIEIKSVMTEHRKAVKNRKRDLEAHHEHVHNYRNDAIAGGILVINAAKTFQSPLRPAVTVHKSPDLLVTHCLNELRAVAVRGGNRGYGLDAKCGIVVDCDNVNRKRCEYVVGIPAPVVGDPLHYDAFIRTICELYSKRFGS